MKTIPTMPRVGDTSRLFGVTFTVTVVEPQADWVWRLEATNADGDVMVIKIPAGERIA